MVVRDDDWKSIWRVAEDDFCPPITPHPPRESLQSLQIDIFNQMIIKHFDEDRHSSIFILHVFKT